MHFTLLSLTQYFALLLIVIKLCETPVWHVDDYVAEMEGPDAEADPLTMKECTEVAEQCLFCLTKAGSLCIGNIYEKGSLEVADVISNHFSEEAPTDR